MQKILALNFKMNGDIKFYKSVQKCINNLKVKDTKIILCPPFVYLNEFKKSAKFELGAQNISYEISSKATGEISPIMLNEFGCKYSIVGHSERRGIGESEDLIANRVKTACENKIVPIVCVGENAKTSDINVLKEQVLSAIKFAGNKDLIFAYEPVWAIGTGEIPTIERINKAIELIKKELKTKKYNSKVLYGGSANNSNVKELLTSEADGFLLGGISLKLDELKKFIEVVENE